MGYVYSVLIELTGTGGALVYVIKASDVIVGAARTRLPIYTRAFRAVMAFRTLGHQVAMETVPVARMNNV